VRYLKLFLAVLLFSSCVAQLASARPRWSEAEARAWYQKQPWLVGSNFIPSSAINQLEMWQAETFDPQEIDKELGWAENANMNTMRVFLHDLLWEQDAAGFPNITFDPCLLCSIPAGIRSPSWVRSTRRFPAYTTRGGCSLPGRRRSRTQRNTRV
jgi:hypothetical protein